MTYLRKFNYLYNKIEKSEQETLALKEDLEGFTDHLSCLNFTVMKYWYTDRIFKFLGVPLETYLATAGKMAAGKQIY